MNLRSLTAVVVTTIFLLAGCGGGTGEPGGGGGGGGGGHPFTGNFIAYGTGYMHTMNLTNNGKWIRQITMSRSYDEPSLDVANNLLYVASLNAADPLFITPYDLPGFSQGPRIMWPDTEDGLSSLYRFAAAPGGKYMAATMDGPFYDTFLEVLDAETGQILLTVPNFWVESNMLWTSDMRLVLSIESPGSLPEGVHGAIIAIPLNEFTEADDDLTGDILLGFSQAQWGSWGPDFIALNADESQMAYVLDGDIWVKDLGTDASPYQITRGPTANVGPAFSPDGSYIAFVGGRYLGSSDTFILPNDRNGPYLVNLDDPQSTEAYVLDRGNLADAIMAWLP